MICKCDHCFYSHYLCRFAVNSFNALVIDLFLLPGLQLGLATQSSINLANFLYSDALPAFAERCVYIQGNPAQSRLLGTSCDISMLSQGSPESALLNKSSS